jgi:hydroxymethylglutaryl-CoA reductase
MAENVVGMLSIPLGIATNFVINGKERLVPMAIEEPSVIAAASHAAKIAKVRGGFTASTGQSLMVGQVQVISVSDPKAASAEILTKKELILSKANEKNKTIVATDLTVRELTDESPNQMGRMLLVEIIVDTKDAMGANAINSMCESIAPLVAEISGGDTVLKILSNYATKRLVRCSAVFDKDELGGSRIVERILHAYALAYSDVYRAVTHNKGIMNGIDAVALATGQDFRAIEAAAHAYAARDGRYRSLTKWLKAKDGDLVGEIELPIAVGVVGGVASVNPTAKISIKILGATSASELAICMAAAGLAQNLAALRALASEGIQKGHMRLHANNIAVTAGAKGREIELVASKLAEEGTVTVQRARQILALMRK